MTGRERFLAALNNQKPDHLPCQVHDWMAYYLNKYLGGMDPYAAYQYFDMDPVIYVGPRFIYDEDRNAREWKEEIVDFGVLKDGYRHWERYITTPEGKLVEKGANNAFTGWLT